MGYNFLSHNPVMMLRNEAFKKHGRKCLSVFFHFLTSLLPFIDELNFFCASYIRYAISKFFQYGPV